jgi:hypothetical protein
LCQLGSLTINVAAGSSLSLNDQVRNGGIVKTGEGALFLNGSTSRFEKGFTAEGGLFAVKDMSVFAPLKNSPEASLNSGTLFIGADGGVEEHLFPFTLKVAASSNSEAVVLANDDDITFVDFMVQSGALIKRGSGRATVELTRYRNLTRGNGASSGSGTPPSLPLNFPADGTAPEDGYSGLTIAEGEFLVKGTEGVTPPITADASHQTLLGTWSTNEVVAPPKMTADFATFKHYYVYTGFNAYVGEYPENARTQTISVVNGGVFSFNTLNVGNVVDATKPTYDTMLNVDVDNAEFTARSAININRKNAGLNINAKNSAKVNLGFSSTNIKGPVTIDLQSGSVLTGTQDVGVDFNCQSDAELTANIASGSTFVSKLLYWNKVPSNKFTFNFDDGFWSLGAGEALMQIAFGVGEQVRFVAQSGGMGFDVPEGVSWQLYHPVYGEGGIFKRGLGTLRIEEAGGYKLDQSAITNFVDKCVVRSLGRNRVEEGVLVATGGADGASFEVASEATLLAEGEVRNLELSGSGTIAGGTFRRLKILPRADAVLKLDGVLASGPVIVDLGRSTTNPFDELPANIKVADIAAGFNPSFTWRLVGTGRTNVRGIFRVEGGSVYVDAVEMGATIIIR